MLKKTVNRMAFKNYVPEQWSLVKVLDSDDNFTGYYNSYSDDLDDAVRKMESFWFWHLWNIIGLKVQKKIRFDDECPDECLREFIF